MGYEKPRNILMNFINEITGVTSEVFPEDHFTQADDQGGFIPWTAEQIAAKDGSWLPQCELTIGGRQVRDFQHLEMAEREPASPIRPWLHTK
jgi:hypothetical protein